MDSSQMQLPIGESLVQMWHNVTTALAANDVAALESAVHNLATLSATDKTLIEEILAMMPQPQISPMLMTQIFSDPEVAIGALSRLGAANSSALAASFGAVESAIVLSSVVSWMQTQGKESQLVKDLATESASNNPINTALKTYIESKGSMTAEPTTQSFQYLRDNPILLSTLKTADPELLTKAFQIAESQIVLACLDQMIESQAKIKETQIADEKKREMTTLSPGQQMLQAYLHDIKEGKLELSQPVVMAMQFLLVSGAANSPQANLITPIDPSKTTVNATAPTLQAAPTTPIQSGATTTQSSSALPAGQAVAVGQTVQVVPTAPPSQQAPIIPSGQTTAVTPPDKATAPAEANQLLSAVGSGLAFVPASQITPVVVPNQPISLTTPIQSTPAKPAPATPVSNASTAAPVQLDITQTTHIGQVGNQAPTATINQAGTVLSYAQTETIVNTAAIAAAGATLGAVPINDISKSWDAGFQSIMPNTPNNQIANSPDLQLQLGFLASVYSQMAPYWSIPAAISFLTIAGGVKEKAIPEAAVKAYAAAIGTLISHPDFTRMVENLILRTVKNPESITPEQLKIYTAALKILLLANAFVAVQLTIYRKSSGQFSPQEMYDMIMGKIPLPAEDDILYGLVRLIQEELKNLPEATRSEYLASLLSTYSDASDINSLIDPSSQFLRLCDQRYFQNQTSSESI